MLNEGNISSHHETPLNNYTILAVYEPFFFSNLIKILSFFGFDALGAI